MKRIIHLSDLHFGTERIDLLNLVRHEIKQNNPDLIVISGDLTQRAKNSQFCAAKKFVDSLNRKIICVPGNHDISLYNPIERFLYPFSKYKKWISPDLCVSYMHDNIAMLGINSVTPYKPMSGYVTKSQLKLIVDFFTSQSNNKIKIVIMHHNLISSERHKIINDSEKLIDVFCKCKVNLVLSGHIHAAHVELLRQTNDTSLYVITAGTAISTRTLESNSFNIIDIDDKWFKLIVKKFDGNDFVTSYENKFILIPD